MDYQKHYDNLINRAQNRVLSGYCEKHHIIPKCLQPPTFKIVALTPEEHYVAHQLLVKLHPDNVKILIAAVSMAHGNGKQKRNNRLYGWLRRRLSERLKGRTYSDETRALMSANHNYACHLNRPKHTQETKMKMSLASKGKQKSEEHKKNLVKAKRGKKRGEHSFEHRRKISESNKETKQDLTKWDSGFLNDPEYKRNQSETMKVIWSRRKNGELPLPNHKHGGASCLLT